LLKRLRSGRLRTFLLIGVVLSVLLVAGSCAGLVGARLVGHYSWTVEKIFRPAPEQPIAFPHPTHVDNGIDCVFCHRLAPTESMASIPPVEQCIFCHQIIGKGPDGRYESQELGKLVMAFQDDQPINWRRVHRLPDHVRFVHEAHVTFFTAQEQYGFASATCTMCHGDVGEMMQVGQDRSLKMGDCMACHRNNGAPTDCVTCHY
jgi:hypothetical protein